MTQNELEYYEKIRNNPEDPFFDELFRISKDEKVIPIAGKSFRLFGNLPYIENINDFPNLQTSSDFSSILHSGKIYIGETIRGMPYVSPLLEQYFSSRSTEDITKMYFPDAEKEKKGNIDIYTDPECDFDGEIISEDFYYDSNKSGKFGDTVNGKKDEYAFSVKLYISKSGNKLKEAHACARPKDKEILLFLENNEGDISGQVLLSKITDQTLGEFYANENVYKHINRKFPIEKEKLTELLKNGKIEAKYITLILKGLLYLSKIFSTPAKVLGSIVEEIANGIKSLSLSEKIWDTEASGYYFHSDEWIQRLSIDTGLLTQIESTINSFNAERNTYLKVITRTVSFPEKIKNFVIDFPGKIISRLIQWVKNYNLFISNTFEKMGTAGNMLKIPESVAFGCGVWNGLIDFISSILELIAYILKTPFNLAENFFDIIETVDSFLDSILNIKWESLMDSLSSVYQNIKGYLLKNDNDFNWVRIAYCSGFAVSFIATFFIPYTQLAKLVNLSKISKFLPAGLFEKIGSSVHKSITFIEAKSAQALRNTLRLIEKMGDLLAKGKEQITKFFDKIWKQIAEWFLENKKTFSLVNGIDNSLVPLINILKNNRLYLKCLELVKGKSINGLHGRQLGRWLTVESEAMIKLYSSFVYKNLNEALRKGIKISRENKAMQKVLDDALEKLPLSKYNNQELYRAALFSEKEIKKLFKVGKEFTEKGFFSTTHSNKALLFWLEENPTQNVIFKVYGKNGRLIKNVSFYPEEAEVLFKSGTMFVVESIKEIDHPFHIDKLVTEILLKEI